MKPLAVITGVGPGTGASLARRFHDGGYEVAMLARNAERLAAMEAALPGARGHVCDVTDPAALEATLGGLRAPKVLIHNAVGGAFGDFQAITPETLAWNFEVNVMALLRLAQWAAPVMKPAGGTILVTGNTSSLRGRANFAGFAPTKAAQRILAESIARSLGPQGIHVAYLLIDAAIDMPRTRARQPDKPDDFFMPPDAIADEAWHLAHQPPAAWSFLTEIRPSAEVW